MPQGLTAKQEKFAFLYAKIGNASEAYRRSYDAKDMLPATIWSEACLLLQTPKVSTRVADLKAKLAEKHEVTLVSLSLELEEARQLAMETSQTSSAVSASMGKAKLHGYLRERLELSGQVATTNTELFEKMTTEERANLRAMLTAAAARLPKPANQNDTEQAGVVPKTVVAE